jgi:hypothetical protein
MNLLTSLHSIFQDEESMGWEEGVEAAGLEADLEAAELEETFDGGGQYSEEEEDEEDNEEEEGHEEVEEGHEKGARLNDEGWGDGSTSGSASSH